MRTRQEVIDFCLSLNDTYEDYPFHDFNWTIMRHKGNQKMFAAIYEHLGNIWVNVNAIQTLHICGGLLMNQLFPRTI